MSEVDRAEEQEKEENKVKELFESGDKNCCGIAYLLEKVLKPDQLPIYYAGGFKLLGSAVNNSKFYRFYLWFLLKSLTLKS